jgi:hypothetical protein
VIVFAAVKMVLEEQNDCIYAGCESKNTGSRMEWRKKSAAARRRRRRIIEKEMSLFYWDNHTCNRTS